MKTIPKVNDVLTIKYKFYGMPYTLTAYVRYVLRVDNPLSLADYEVMLSDGSQLLHKKEGDYWSRTGADDDGRIEFVDSKKSARKSKLNVAMEQQIPPPFLSQKLQHKLEQRKLRRRNREND